MEKTCSTTVVIPWFPSVGCQGRASEGRGLFFQRDFLSNMKSSTIPSFMRVHRLGVSRIYFFIVLLSLPKCVVGYRETTFLKKGRF